MSRIAKQKNRIIGYIEEYGSITVKEAQEHLGIGDPRKRISELRENGYPISDEWENGINRFGEHCRYKRYYMKES